MSAPRYHAPPQPPGRGPNGRPFCRICAAEVPLGRRTICSVACEEEIRIRAGIGTREAVDRRDRGVCWACGLDTGRLDRLLHRLRNVCAARATQAALLPWGSPLRTPAGLLAEQQAVAEDRRAADELARRGVERLGAGELVRWHKGAWAGFTWPHLWEADHIVPVVEGGGACGLDGLRTLCRQCHVAETRKLRARLARDRTNQPRLLEPERPAAQP